MDYYAGIDVSLELSSVCILEASGQIAFEAKVASEPEVLAAFPSGVILPLTRVSLEAVLSLRGPMQACRRQSLRSCCSRPGM
jgi:hypothetical protein